MLKLSGTQPIIIAIAEGASVTLEAPSPRIMAAGRAASRALLNDDADLNPDELALAFSEGILTAAITGFEGIGDDAGEPLEFSPDAVQAILQDPFVFDQLDTEYVLPIAMRTAEKNGLSSSPDGTLTRETLDNDTANSAADMNPVKKSSAAETSPKKSRAAAKSAHTAKTRRKRQKAG